MLDRLLSREEGNTVLYARGLHVFWADLKEAYVKPVRSLLQARCAIRGFTELCTQHLFAPPPPLRSIVPALPSSLEHVIMTALAKDPHRRFVSCGAFAQAMQEEVLAIKLPLEQTPPRKESP